MVQFGVDLLLSQDPSWKKQPIALVTNHAATTYQLSPSRQVLLQNGFNIVKLFSPEHGLDVKGVDGATMSDGFDELTGLPITSLYSNKLEPSAQDLQGIGIVLFDIPDVGCRYYTYLWTMTHVLQACAKQGKQLIVLDRPNPISGMLALAEGPMLDEANCASFIGRWNIPLRHSCTFGELALYFNQVKNIHAHVQVIKCSNWHREFFQHDWGVDFVPTSPAIQNEQAALLYPGLGLLEATNISEGRGTGLSFQVAGAPWMDGNSTASAFNHFGLGNVQLQSVTFTPIESKYKNEQCNGVRFNVTHAPSYQPVFTGLLFIKLVKDLYPQHFQWKPYPTHVNPTGYHHLDKLLGIPDSEKLFGLPMHAFLQQVEAITNVRHWQQSINSFLLYS